MSDERCGWKKEFECGRRWESECGMSFVFREYDGPEDNGFRYCPNCGKKLDEHCTEEEWVWG